MAEQRFKFRQSGSRVELSTSMLHGYSKTGLSSPRVTRPAMEELGFQLGPLDSGNQAPGLEGWGWWELRREKPASRSKLTEGGVDWGAHKGEPGLSSERVESQVPPALSPLLCFRLWEQDTSLSPSDPILTLVKCEFRYRPNGILATIKLR